MKKVFFTLLLFVVPFSTIKAQKIDMKKSFGENVYYQNDKKLNSKELKVLMKNNTEALDFMESAKSNQTWGMILGGAGGALIGYPVGTAIGGGDPQWVLAGAGAALIVATIPILKGYNRKTKKAVDLYNASAPDVSSNFKPTFNFILKGTSMGISMAF
ncbi:hypothetical protein [uncultured Polaribacter sp.]|uniref:hypothetical protein n=1 Tax=uncultured Polaribacter sp. TaxID=174711 RepID=UPI00260A08F6|nr:hypothetical protein [uncultured Polaribacter sp.]